MFEDFEDAFCFASDLLEEAVETARHLLRCFIYVTVPVWIVPYAIYRVVKEAKEDGI